MTKITLIIRILWFITIISIIVINRSNTIIVSGGDSEAVFKISTKQSSVLGYIDGGSPLIAGCGNLINLSLKDTSNTLSDIKIKNEFSQIVNFDYFNLDHHYGNITNGCELPANSLFLKDGKVLYNSSVAISSFQFNVDNTTLVTTYIIIFILLFLTMITTIRALESRNQWRRMIDDGEVEVKEKMSFD